ncbi:phosphate propanoyltransferase [Aneurinibacillus thermoaerophilus]|uniref:Phosphate propanoyltransferase n=2 Tax=Aneurinibacillus thermoaerophilus TaxID=143495 RepID=A0A1G7YXW8_ANETH|nr:MULTISPECIES: phosphate propanoyltransferase [Aneurinibacillus]MED0674435.1 phosphate propanoyltransferase [Aneurinibacillus thermoaerophilus]MED0678452.1 phosphate propanoyltransferase [Aneurinibacillus thermoaerophilus]MED0736024.1 phosphate propanoyltransferase [Aneurinibacillus thermoaerophilus]MED0758940.1 phosphate propanoyltransferase [Aneurinibacillus thermoaerophilus]MED0761034.1 phosphate propanoyltransferase [Aneurinibacillus thermoaerophilus]
MSKLQSKFIYKCKEMGKGWGMMRKIIEQSNKNLTESLAYQLELNTIPVGISARHVHLSLDHIDILFGKGYQLRIHKELSQPGQFAAKESVMIAGPKGTIDKVRILGPARCTTQVEVSLTDAHRLGISPPIRDSGDLAGSSPITIIGPKGSIYLKEGAIIASRHIHMSEEDARQFQVHDREKVHVVSQTKRGVIFSDVKIRVSADYRLEFHIDTDEANAAGLTNQDRVWILK